MSARIPMVGGESRAPGVGALVWWCVVGAAGAVLCAAPARAATGGAGSATGSAAGDVRAASVNARWFLEDYLRYLHGRFAARRVRCTAARLRDELPAASVHSSAVARRRVGRIAELHTQLIDPKRADVRARVLDGSDTTLTVVLTAQHTAGGWEVSDVAHR